MTTYELILESLSQKPIPVIEIISLINRMEKDYEELIENKLPTIKQAKAIIIEASQVPALCDELPKEQMDYVIHKIIKNC